MNRSKLGLVVCANYLKELTTIVNASENDNIEVFCVESICSNPTNSDKTKFSEHIEQFKQKVQEIRILTPQTCTGYNLNNKGTNNCQYSCSNVCTEMIAPKGFVNQLIDEGSYITTPGWLKNWKNFVQKKWQFSEQNAKIFFKDTTKQICILDTGVYENYTNHLNDFSQFVGLEYKIINIGNDYFKYFIEKLIISWQAEQKEKKAKKNIRDANKRIADYTMAFEIIKDLSNLSSEDALIQNIFQLFSILFSPNKMVYIPLEEGKQGNVKTYLPGDLGDKQITEKSANISTFMLSSSKKGFKIEATYNNEILGYLKIDEILFPEHIDNYISLTNSISSVLGLLIYNSRQYNLLLKDKLAILQKSEKKLQLKNLELNKQNQEYAALNEEYKTTNDDLKLAREKSEQQKKLLEIIAENYPNSFISIIEKNLTIGFSSGQEFRRQNLNPNDFVGLTIDQVFKEHTKTVKKYYLKTFRGEETTFELIINDQYQLYKTVPLFSENNQILKIMVVVENITERKKAERELIRAKEKAEESDRLKTAFLQNMSHEIRTPMNAICGFSSMLNKPEVSDEKLDSFVSIIQNSSNQLLSIVTDILTISSLETKQVKTDSQITNVNSILINLLSTFKPQALNHNISLRTKQDLTNSQSEIYTDKTKLIQILTNLISNALKFTHTGHIEFGYNLKKTKLEFYVVDTGIGINPEMHEKIFERFRQEDRSIQNNYGGTGLGLSISKGFVEILGGKIWVQSKPQKGSTFYFTIPYKPVNEAHQTITQSKQNEDLKTILVAEDEEYNFLFIKEVLNNISLIHAKDGQETVKICKENPSIDLILMDIKMPIMEGHTASKLIREFKPDLPIIAQSAYALEHEIEKYSGIFDDYITKPICEKELKQKINRFLKN